MPKRTCSVEGCERPHKTRGLCGLHHQRLVNGVDPAMWFEPSQVGRGRKNRVSAHGYVEVYRPDHPLARRNGYLFEHRMVAWDAGLLTDPTLHVHHKNHNKQDNRLENLEVVSNSEHGLLHMEERGYSITQNGNFPVRPRELRQGKRWVMERRQGRFCGLCGNPIPITRKLGAKWCSQRCAAKNWDVLHGKPKRA